MFPTPDWQPPTEEQILDTTFTLMEGIGLDAAIVLLIAITIALLAWWWFAGRGGDDD